MVYTLEAMLGQVIAHWNVEGLGTAELVRPSNGFADSFVFRIYLNTYQSACSRMWLDLRWSEPCLRNALVLLDRPHARLLLQQHHEHLLLAEAEQKFCLWLKQLQAACTAYMANRV